MKHLLKGKSNYFKKKLDLLEEIEKQPKSLFEFIHNLGYSIDCSWEIVDAVEAFQKSKENEQGTWNYDPDAKFRKQEEVEKLQEKDWSYKITDEHGETNPYKQYLHSEKEWEPSAQTPEQVEEGLRSAMKQAKKEGVFDEPEYYDELVENGVSENKQNQRHFMISYTVGGWIFFVIPFIEIGIWKLLLRIWLIELNFGI